MTLQFRPQYRRAYWYSGQAPLRVRYFLVASVYHDYRMEFAPVQKNFSSTEHITRYLRIPWCLLKPSNVLGTASRISNKVNGNRTKRCNPKWTHWTVSILKWYDIGGHLQNPQVYLYCSAWEPSEAPGEIFSVRQNLWRLTRELPGFEKVQMIV